MELCALALIEGGTELSSTPKGVRWGKGRDLEAPRGVIARSVLRLNLSG